ncbi:MAG: FlgD immunoglobulin-like domain containing protein [bacterium]
MIKLGGVSLKKQSLPPSTPAASLALVPSAFQLYPNFPNPFNPETQIRFDLPEAAQVDLRIYNALGQLVRTLVDRSYSAGTFTVFWDSRDDEGKPLPSGIYFYKIKAGNFQAQRKLLLLK